MEHSKISVIVALYNTEKLIQRCLESIVKQSYPNLEIVVVDDGSTDKSVAIVEKMIQKDSRIKLVHHEGNKGLYHARITGVEAATGDYIGFVDSDDYISKDYYQSLLEAALQEHADITVGKIIHEDKTGYRYVHNLYHFYEFGVVTGNEITEQFWNQEGRCFIWHTIWNKLYSRSVWEKALPQLKKQKQHLIMTEDFAFSSVLFNYAQVLTSTEYGAYFYYQHSDASTSLSGRLAKFEKNIGDLKTAFVYVDAFISSKEYRVKVKEKFIRWRTLYRKFWMDNIRNSGLKAGDKNKAVLLLNEALLGDETTVRDDSFFYAVTSTYDNKYNDMIDKILSDKTEVVSFDIFDTAIIRPFYKPTDLFYLADKEAQELLHFNRASFSDMRIQAEKEVRKKKIYQEETTEEISLDDIYDYIKEMWNLPKTVIQQLKEKEKELELKFCKARKSVYHLYRTAVLCGKRVFFTTDMYLDRKTIEAILNNNGYKEYEEILLSSEKNVTKRTGRLYRVLLERNNGNAKSIVHIGDNWDSDVDMALKNGIDGIFYPKTTDCIQYKLADVKTTHSACAYKEPTGTIVNYEKAMEYLGTRTALAVAANRLYDNPFIPFNEWSEMNCSPQYLGYYALGMHLLGFTKWMMEEAVCEEYDTLAFISRDGYLPMGAYRILKKYYSYQPAEKYLYTSRKAAIPCGITNLSDMYMLYENVNAETLTVEDFLDLLEPLLDAKCVWILKKNGISLKEKMGDYHNFCRIAKVIYEKCMDRENQGRYNWAVSAYLEKILFGKAAVVDIGYSGRTQEMIQLVTGKSVDAFYVHANDDKCCKRERRYHFNVKNFYDYTPSITGGVRELLFSEYAPSCIRYELKSDYAEPVFETFTKHYCEEYVIGQIQKYALSFVEDYAGLFGEYLTFMDMRNIDISQPYEFFLSTLTEADGKMFECFWFEDDMWAGDTFSLKQYWQECIGYHKLTAFCNRQNTGQSAAVVSNGNLSWQLYNSLGMEKKNIFRKAMFWLFTDRDFFVERLKEHLKQR